MRHHGIIAATGRLGNSMNSSSASARMANRLRKPCGGILIAENARGSSFRNGKSTAVRCLPLMNWVLPATNMTVGKRNRVVPSPGV